MNKEIKDRWIEALQSGEYKQGIDWLNNATDNTYCCLGVLCELATKEGIVSKVRTHGKFSRKDPDYVFAYGKARFTSILPIEVSEWADIDREGSFYNKEENYDTLAALNDEGVSFEEIADIIADYF